MIILIYNIVVDLISLLFQEVLGPDHLGQDVVHTDKLGISLTLGVQFLFDRLDVVSSCFRIHGTTSLAPCVLV